MRHKVIHFILIIAIICNFAVSAKFQNRTKASPCKIKNIRGRCLPINRCPKVLDSMRREGIVPQVCFSSKKVLVVCCTSTKPPPPPTCKPFGIDKLKVNKTESKAWNKCIDILNIIYPCIDAMTPNGKIKIRENRCNHDAVELIMGGRKTKLNEFPHMALLGYENKEYSLIEWSCGGTLISDEWVLTAEHCTRNLKTMSEVKHVRLGILYKYTQMSRNTHFTVSEIVHHPSYTALQIYNDIALLKLNKPAIFSENIIPACLHTGNLILDAKTIATGWGKTESGGTSDYMLKTVIKKYGHSKCKKMYNVNRRLPEGVKEETQLCYGDSNMLRDTCSGDSGGPIQIYNMDVHCTYLVVGITSTGSKECATSKPALYTKVAAYIDWIEHVVWP